MNAKTLTCAALVFIGLHLVIVRATAAELSVKQCPSRLTVKQNISSSAEDGWKAVDSEEPLPAKYIVISAGEYPVKQTGFEVPTEEKLHNGERTVYYDHVNEPNYWAVCGYSDSRVVLVQKLPENAVRCEVKYISDVTVPDGITIKCFDTPRAKE